MKGAHTIAEKEITLKLYSLLIGDFYRNDIYGYAGPDSDSDASDLFMGADMARLEGSIRKAVEEFNDSRDIRDLMTCFPEERDSGVKGKVLSAVPSVELRKEELMGCTTVKLREPLTASEMKALQKYLTVQFSEGWGKGFEQQEIRAGDGILYVHFGIAPVTFEVEQDREVETVQEQTSAQRPKLKLVGRDGNIFSILGKASRLLKENGQPEQAKKMSERVYQSGNYYKALAIISEYVETELSDHQTPDRKPKDRDTQR